MDRDRAEKIRDLMDIADMYGNYERFCEERNITYIPIEGDMTINLMHALMDIYTNNIVVHTLDKPMEKMVEVKKELLHRDKNIENIAGIYS